MLSPAEKFQHRVPLKNVVEDSGENVVHEVILELRQNYQPQLAGHATHDDQWPFAGCRCGEIPEIVRSEYRFGFRE
jgi:hypothetical protein